MKKTNSILLLLVALISSMIFSNTLFSQSNFHNTHYLDPYNPEYVKGEVLIKFKDEVQVESSTRSGVAKTGIISVDILLEPYQIETIDKVFQETREQRQRKTVRTIRDFKGNEIEVPALFNIYKIKFDTIWDAKQIIEDLQQDNNIEFVEPNYLVYTNEVIENGGVPNDPPKQTPLPTNTGRETNTLPNDPLYSQQWYLPAINAPAAWDLVTGDTTQIIAIIDTGVDWDHPDLDDNIWTNWNEIPDNGIDDDNNGYIDDTRGWDYINNDNDPNDDNSHGTHVAGIAAAEGNNGIGICGVAWNSRIMPIKMLQSSGTGSYSDLASAIEYAYDNGATVINMSLGSYGQSVTVENVLINAYINSLLVAAAGNDGLCICSDCMPCGNMYPGAYPFVLGVQCEGGFSNTDPSGPIDFTFPSAVNYEVRAPGVNILSTIPNGYRAYNGTSMATPLVSGICALVKNHNDTLFTDFLWAKLIFGSENGFVNAYNTLTLDLDSIGPDLRFIEYTLTDTLPGCDGDGRADAGETIQIHFTVKNVGGYADSAWTNLRFSEFEDTTTAVITDSTSYIGDISTWASLTSELSPLEIKIDSNVAHNRDIVFEYEISCANGSDTITNDLIINVERGIELSGVLDTLLVLTANKKWIINNSFRIGTVGKLVVRPGTEVIIMPGYFIDLKGQVIAKGTKDSIITFTSTSNLGAGFFRNSYVSTVDTFSFCSFKDMGNCLGTNSGSNATFYLENCLIENIGFAPVTNTSIRIDGVKVLKNTVIRNMHLNNNGAILYTNSHGIDTIESNNFYNIDGNTSAISSGLDDATINNNNFINVASYHTSSPNALYTAVFFLGNSNPNFFDNNIINSENLLTTFQYLDNIIIGPQYWGNMFGDFDNQINDFWDDPSLPQLLTSDTMTLPNPLAHGMVWKVELNGINPFDETLDPIGSEIVKFDVYFNRPMDITYTPLLGFGVFEPYLQRIVSDSVQWSSDSTIWTAYYTINPETGDGINTVHVRNARDPEGFEIPPEKYRFKFVIQAASAASVQFYATPGIGKVELEWPPTPTTDALGYNLYRSYNLTDSTFSDTLMINTELILDTVYTDYNIIPDTTYHYFYKTLGTDMVETDYSKRVTATPFDAANGDANGDLAVNVLDITTIVSYMLNQSPSPFLFDAADVNYDDEINVLDIIGLVQLINGKKNLSIQPLPEFSRQTAYYSVNDNVMSLESKGNVAALQFRIVQKNNNILPLGEMSAGQRGQRGSIFSLQPGFEFAYSTVSNEIIGILYSLSGREIPEGVTELFRFEGIDSGDVEIVEIFGGDLNGDYVPVLKKGEGSVIFASDAELQANPNPFASSTQINYTVPENGIVDIRLFDMTGAEITKLENTYHNAGKHSIHWNGTNNKEQLLTPGIYLLQLKVKSVSGNVYNKEVKVVLTK